MTLEITISVLILVVVIFISLRIRKEKHYKKLEAMQEDIVAAQENCLEFSPYRLDELPSFVERVAVIPHLLPDKTFNILREAVLRCAKAERSYFPGHKKGGTVSFEELHLIAPQIVAFYHSQYLRQLCSSLIGQSVVPTPLNDQSSCSLLFYDKPKDHIGWHYDYNFYRGRHFTVLLPVINRHNSEDRCSSANLVIIRQGQEITLPTPPNTLILFEGAYVYHKVTKLAENETRILISMTFCTDPAASVIKSYARRFKDVAYFGIRALWT